LAPEVQTEVYLQIPGRHNVYNALAAAAVGFELGLTAEQVVAGLERATAGDMRMQVFCTASGVTVVNDAYNANPTSMRAALDTLAEMQTSGRRVAVLGDMAELGSLTELAHFRIGEHVAELPIDVLLTVGPRAKRIADAAKAGGFDPANAHVVESADQAAAVLATQVEAGDIVLVKASRVMGLEHVVERIVGA
jgi:UDP-N-acetylmuramoyl-tripeptide--D-alanyl-D-alanine ligase